jgi:hypothetical protein
MGLFGRKKEVKVENVSQMKIEAQRVAEAKEANRESLFTSPEDFMKFTSEQLNTKLSQPAPVQNIEPIKPVNQIPQLASQSMQQEKQNFAPLFIKIDRYKNILRSLSELKTTLAIAKNAFVMLEQMEKIKSDNLNLISNAMDKVEKKLVVLDAEFLRPSGFQDEMSDTYEMESLQGVISDLRTQIEELKNDMQQVG